MLSTTSQGENEASMFSPKTVLKNVVRGLDAWFIEGTDANDEERSGSSETSFTLQVPSQIEARLDEEIETSVISASTYGDSSYDESDYSDSTYDSDDVSTEAPDWNENISGWNNTAVTTPPPPQGNELPPVPKNSFKLDGSDVHSSSDVRKKKSLENSTSNHDRERAKRDKNNRKKKKRKDHLSTKPRASRDALQKHMIKSKSKPVPSRRASLDVDHRQPGRGRTQSRARSNGNDNNLRDPPPRTRSKSRHRRHSPDPYETRKEASRERSKSRTRSRSKSRPRSTPTPPPHHERENRGRSKSRPRTPSRHRSQSRGRQKHTEHKQEKTHRSSSQTMHKGGGPTPKKNQSNGKSTKKIGKETGRRSDTHATRAVAEKGKHISRSRSMNLKSSPHHVRETEKPRMMSDLRHDYLKKSQTTKKNGDAATVAHFPGSRKSSGASTSTGSDSKGSNNRFWLFRLGGGGRRKRDTFEKVTSVPETSAIHDRIDKMLPHISSDGDEESSVHVLALDQAGQEVALLRVDPPPDYQVTSMLTMPSLDDNDPEIDRNMLERKPVRGGHRLKERKGSFVGAAVQAPRYYESRDEF